MASLIQDTYVVKLPFNISSNGKIGTILDSSLLLWKQKVLSLLSTGSNERIWYREHGINMYELLFETSTTVVEDFQVAVAEMFNSWLPELTLVDFSIKNNDMYGELRIGLTYKTPAGILDSVTVTKASLTAAGETIEVN